MSCDTTRPAVSVHRFADAAALAILRTSGTVYLEPADARALAAALDRAADSIDSERFTDSAFGSFAVPALAVAGASPRLERSPDGRRADLSVGLSRARAVSLAFALVQVAESDLADATRAREIADAGAASAPALRDWRDSLSRRTEAERAARARLAAARADLAAAAGLPVYWIEPGRVTDSDAHGGRAPVGAAEYQFSDGPPGARSMSADFLSVREGVADLGAAFYVPAPDLTGEGGEK